VIVGIYPSDSGCGKDAVEAALQGDWHPGNALGALAIMGVSVI
jgi:hypothetical protein